MSVQYKRLFRKFYFIVIIIDFLFLRTMSHVFADFFFSNNKKYIIIHLVSRQRELLNYLLSMHSTYTWLFSTESCSSKEWSFRNTITPSRV